MQVGAEAAPLGQRLEQIVELGRVIFERPGSRRAGQALGHRASSALRPPHYSCLRQQSTDEPTAGERIIASLQEAVAWSQGEPVPVRVTTVEVPKVDVRKIRTRLRLSHDEFAARFGFAHASIRNWEQGRRRPEGPARLLLAMIDRHPEIVEEVVRGQ